MMVETMQPCKGPTTGGNVVCLRGRDFDAGMLVLFDATPAPLILLQRGACYVQAPAHPQGQVPVVVKRGGEHALPPEPYTYALPLLTEEAPLTRLVRALLRDLKKHFLRNTRVTVDIDASGDVPGIAAVARLPALVLGGPDVQPSRHYSRNAGHEVEDGQGNFLHYAAPYTADLHFSLTGASHSTVEMFNMLDAAVSHLHHAKWVSMPRDEAFPELGHARWPLCMEEAARVFLDGIDGIRSFGLTFSIRGFDIGTYSPTAVSPKAADSNLVIAGSNQYA